MMLPAFYPVLDTGLLEARGLAPAIAAEALLDAGVKILQFRHKQFFSREFVQAAAAIRDLCRKAETTFVINDRADIAKLLDAALHLGQDDLEPTAARRILPQSIIGLSTHNARQLQAADREPVDYLAFGPIFTTSTKQNPDPVVGLDQLRDMRKLTAKPLVAIGGITRRSARSILEAGANSLAIIGDLYPDPLTTASLRSRAEEWLTLCRSA
jgi:thiamine-phosphate pyrophosphorylase